GGRVVEAEPVRGTGRGATGAIAGRWESGGVLPALRVGRPERAGGAERRAGEAGGRGATAGAGRCGVRPRGRGGGEAAVRHDAGGGAALERGGERVQLVEAHGGARGGGGAVPGAVGEVREGDGGDGLRAGSFGAVFTARAVRAGGDGAPDHRPGARAFPAGPATAAAATTGASPSSASGPRTPGTRGGGRGAPAAATDPCTQDPTRAERRAPPRRPRTHRPRAHRHPPRLRGAPQATLGRQPAGGVRPGRTRRRELDPRLQRVGRGAPPPPGCGAALRRPASGRLGAALTLLVQPPQQ